MCVPVNPFVHTLLLHITHTHTHTFLHTHTHADGHTQAHTLCAIVHTYSHTQVALASHTHGHTFCYTLTLITHSSLQGGGGGDGYGRVDDYTHDFTQMWIWRHQLTFMFLFGSTSLFPFWGGGGGGGWKRFCIEHKKHFQQQYYCTGFTPARYYLWCTQNHRDSNLVCLVPYYHFI